MSRKWIVLIAALGGVTGCTVEEVPVETAGKQTEQPAQPAASGTETAEPIDPFYLAIEAERWGVMISNARGIVPFVPDDSEDETLRVHKALKSGAMELLMLRDEVCVSGLLDAETCAELAVPAWVTAFEPTPPSLSELQKRSDWLGEASQPFTAAVCQPDDEGVYPVECMVE